MLILSFEAGLRPAFFFNHTGLRLVLSSDVTLVIWGYSCHLMLLLSMEGWPSASLFSNHTRLWLVLSSDVTLVNAYVVIMNE